MEGWILHSVTLIQIKDNSRESFEKGLIHCKAAGNGTWAPGWELGSGSGDTSMILNRHGAMKSSLLLPCTCALTAPGGLCRVGLHHLEGRAFPHKQNANCCFGEHLSKKKKGTQPTNSPDSTGCIQPLTTMQRRVNNASKSMSKVYKA